MDLETRSPPAGEPPATEEEAWAQVVSRWGDDEAHRAYLARFDDLDGLSRAGRRYREVLRERPEDAAALRWQEEIVKRATVQGLARLPRSRPPRLVRPGWRRLLVAGLMVLSLALLGWLLAEMWRVGGRP
jgi:hypothetical protein